MSLTKICAGLLLVCIVCNTYASSIALSEKCYLQADITFVIDSSGSINELDKGNWALVKNFIKNFVDLLVIGKRRARVALVTFANEGYVDAKLNEFYDVDSLKKRIDRLEYRDGNTNTSGGLYQMNSVIFKPQNGDRPNVDNIAIIITDGKATRDVHLTRKYAQESKNNGVRMLAVGITSSIDQSELEALASYPESFNTFNVAQFTELTDIVKMLLKQTCEPVMTTAPPTSVTGPQNCEKQSDICFLLDGSGSINDANVDNWAKILTFVNSIIDFLPIGRMSTRASVITFSNKGTVIFQLDDVFDKESMKKKIMSIEYIGGVTNTSGGLYKMMHEVFQRQNGDRPKANNIGIVITDGASTRDTHLLGRYAAESKHMGVTMLSVGVTDQVNSTQLKQIATETDLHQTVFQVDQYTQLETILDSLVKTTCFPSTTFAPMTTAIVDVPHCEKEMDLVLILDSSQSVGHGHFTDSMKSFASDLVTYVDLDHSSTRMGLITIGNQANIAFYLNTYSKNSQALNAISQLKYTGGSRNIADSLRTAREEMFTLSSGSRRGTPKMVLIVTNGDSYINGESNSKEAMEEARKLRNINVQVMVAIIGTWYNPIEINGLVSYPLNNNLFQLSGWSKLRSFAVDIGIIICGGTKLCNYNPCGKKGKCVDYPNFHQCNCIERFAGANCTKECDHGKDIVYMVDVSRNSGNDRFEQIMKFTRASIERLRFASSDGRGVSRVGLMTFDNVARVQFNLNAYSTKYDVLNSFTPHYSSGNTPDYENALEVARKMFTLGKGDRPREDNLIVMITDSKPSDSALEKPFWEKSAQLRAEGISIVAVAIGTSRDGDQHQLIQLKKIVSSPSEKNVIYSRYGDLLAAPLRALDRLADTMCENHDPCKNNPCKNKGECVSDVNGYKCACTLETTGTDCERHCNGRVDIMLVLDASGSIHADRFITVKKFAQSLVQKLEISSDKARIGLITWGDSATTVFNLDSYFNKHDVKQAIGFAKYDGGKTHTAAALDMLGDTGFLEANGGRSDVQHYAILITDGNSNIEQERTIPAAIDARQKGVHIITVSVGNDASVKMSEIRGIASREYRDNIFTVNRFDKLSTIVDAVTMATCDDVDECLSNPCHNGGSCINQIKRFECRCVSGYTGKYCTETCSRNMDIAFLLDMSGSTEEHHFTTMDLTREIVYGLDMSFDKTRVGLISYGNFSKIRFLMNKYSEKEEVLNAIYFRPDTGKTNTQEALDRVRRDMLVLRAGARSISPDVVILVTDGHSNIRNSRTIPMARRLQQDGATIYVVSVGDNIDHVEIESVAGRLNDIGSKYVFSLRKSSSIVNLAKQMTDKICNSNF